MLKYTHNFKDIDSFIEHLKYKSEIVGIVEYGGRTHVDMSIGSDYDLTVIYDKPVTKNFNGVHFRIGDIPVDCMILSAEDFSKDTPDNDFLLVHMNCKILFDRDGITKKLLDRIKTAWKASEYLSDCEINTYRFGFRHILDKLEHRLYDNELYSRYLIYSSFDWFLECYARMQNLQIGRAKHQLEYIKNNDAELFEYVNRLFKADDLAVQYEMLRKCAEYMLVSIGGLWADEEVLFHMTPEGKLIEEEQMNFMKRLFE